MKPDITLKFLQRIGILKNLPGLNSLAQNCNDVYLSEGDYSSDNFDKFLNSFSLNE